jgi:hypothetical protein
VVRFSEKDMNSIDLQCTCGHLTGRLLDPTPRTGTRLVCMCDDCQTYAHFLERPDELLDRNGGTEVYQSAPARVRFGSGTDQLRCLRQSPKGLMRWYAACCNTPVVNGLASARWPFASVLEPFYRCNDEEVLDRAFGPVRARTQARFGYGQLPPDAHARAPLGVTLHATRVLARSWLAGEHDPNPFFQQSGAPVVEPRVLSADERQRLRVAAEQRAAAIAEDA